ncbi:MAG: tetraacyldisaccharide 4'-kinase [Salinisphaeraceae bacterium]|nr:tetraacyldisaccharide 4'-kinase [Salinisphaeraceae bacterium]
MPRRVPVRDALERAWYDGSRWIWLLLPLSALYGLIVSIRRQLYARKILTTYRSPAPVLVVGNITVGGTGKTPVVAALVERLSARGLRPGVVTRGYGGQASDWPHQVRGEDDPALYGDEAVLLARRTGVPVVAAPRRADAARQLLDLGVNFIVADDGLQHLALARDAEVEVVDGARGYGNGFLLPAGPLREAQTSRRRVDLRLVNGGEGDFTLQARDCHPLGRPEAREDLRAWSGRAVHAVAAIGHPQRFFDTLTAAGIRVTPHRFPDHHAFDQGDFRGLDDRPIFMTEKDAVKCERLRLPRAFVLPVDAVFTHQARQAVDDLLDRLLDARSH